jgi:hypothetical protein
MKMTSSGRQSPMEDDLKVAKVEYLSNFLLNQTQNFSYIFFQQNSFTKFDPHHASPPQKKIIFFSS